MKKKVKKTPRKILMRKKSSQTIPTDKNAKYSLQHEGKKKLKSKEKLNKFAEIIPSILSYNYPEAIFYQK